jgi:hypothetical protein
MASTSGVDSAAASVCLLRSHGAAQRDSREMRDLNDEQLFLRMAARANDAHAASLAYEELKRRHKDYLLQSFEHVAPAKYYGCEELLNDTLSRAFEKAASFRAEGLPADRAFQRVRAWLARTADRLMKEKWPRDRNGFVRLTTLEQECWEAIADRPAPERTAPARVLAALAQLTSRDREIILLYMHWYDPELVNQRVPDDVVAQICGHHGISKENFRQIVSRTLRRLESVLEGQ